MAAVRDRLGRFFGKRGRRRSSTPTSRSSSAAYDGLIDVTAALGLLPDAGG